MKKNCFQNPKGLIALIYYWLIKSRSFQNTMILCARLPNFHKMITTLSSFLKLKAKEIYHRDHKKLSSKLFRADLALSLGRTWLTFEDTLMKILYAPIKKNLSELTKYLEKNSKNFIKNYRLVSILPTLSKVLEKIMQKKIVNHVNTFTFPYLHCAESVQIQSFSSPHFPVFSPNVEKYRPAKTLYITQCYVIKLLCLMIHLMFIVLKLAIITIT